LKRCKIDTRAVGWWLDAFPSLVKANDLDAAQVPLRNINRVFSVCSAPDRPEIRKMCEAAGVPLPEIPEGR
jgi:hypothetical protein